MDSRKPERGLLRHQASLAGLVVDALTRKRLAGAELELSPARAAGGRLIARSAPDGAFCFVDLPDGAYVLKARLPGAGRRYGEAVQSLALPGPAGRPLLVTLELAPTALEGHVQGTGEGEGRNLWLARVWVEGSGEQALTDEQGHYLLAALEPGPRTLRCDALGHEPRQLRVELLRGACKQLDVVLAPLLGRRQAD